jgi:hypothetical protein
MKVNRRKGLRITTEETTMTNPSRNYKKTRKCFLCGYRYEERYGVPFGDDWICGDCLSTIPLEQLSRVIGKKKAVNSNGFEG